jgi:hypothetical protein
MELGARRDELSAKRKGERAKVISDFEFSNPKEASRDPSAKRKRQDTNNATNAERANPIDAINQKSVVRGQRSEVSGQQSEVGCQRSAIGGR